MDEFLQGDVARRGGSEVVGILFLPCVGVYLVEDYHLRLVAATQFGERLVHYFYLIFKVGMTDVNNVEEQVGLSNFVECAFEGVDKVGWQLADEADGVAEQEGKVVDNDLADGGVERGEELVFCKDVALGEQVHERAFADVGVADECHANHPAAVASLSCLLLVDFGKPLLEQAHAVEDDASVHFELRLAWSAQSHRAFSSTATRAAALSLEVSPEALQAREHIPVLCQLDLRLGVGRLSAHGKDVEDKRRAVQNLDFQLAFDVSELLGRQLIVEDDHGDFSLGVLFCFDEGAYLLELAYAEIGDAVGAVHALCEASDGLCPSRLGQEFQFVEVLGGLAFVLCRRDDADEDCSLGRVVDDVVELRARHAVLERQRRARGVVVFAAGCLHNLLFGNIQYTIYVLFSNLSEASGIFSAGSVEIAARGVCHRRTRSSSSSHAEFAISAWSISSVAPFLFLSHCLMCPLEQGCGGVSHPGDASRNFNNLTLHLYSP